MYCCNCGKKLGEEDRFCDNCGTPVYQEIEEEGQNLETAEAFGLEKETPKENLTAKEESRIPAGENIPEREPFAVEKSASEEATAEKDPVPEKELGAENESIPEGELSAKKDLILEKDMSAENESALEETAESSGRKEKPVLEEATGEVILETGRGPDPGRGEELDLTVPLQEDGANLSDLEKRIMKNMEDELILEMPEAAQSRAFTGEDRKAFYGKNAEEGNRYGGGQSPHGGFPYGQGERGPGWQQYGEPPAYGEGQRKEKPEKNKKKVWIIALSSVVALLLVAVVIMLFLLFSPENKLKDHIENRDWAAVSNLYEEQFKGNEKKIEKAHEIFQETVEELKEAFIAGSMDYPTVKRHLKAIEDFWDDDYVRDTLEFVRELGDSRSAFEEAEQHMQREEYEDAIRLYGEVVEHDANYDTAREKLETAKTKYKEKLLEEAGAYEEVRDYESAIAIVEEGLEVLPGDIELSSRKGEIEEAREEYGIMSILEQAKTYAAQKNYFEAMDVVREGTLENPGNEKLETAFRDYSEKYKQDILTKAEVALGNDENYEAAILIFDSALRTLDGDYPEVEQTLREKREEYVQRQLEKSERENAQAAIVGIWHGSMVSSGGLDISMDQFLGYAGMPGANMVLDCQPSGALHLELLGEIGDGTWIKDGAENGVYYLEVEGDAQEVRIDSSGRLRMELDGVTLIFEKTGEA
ncbi:MAG: hypothetical protein HFI63_09960 [Lachnospiraceae bacterium]|nr:hypothetical protein [Lachnospiraceae bacterium]